MNNGPGLYIVKLNGHGKPALYDTGGEPLGDYTFETTGDALLVFEIHNTIDIANSFTFGNTPITWSLGGKRIVQPVGNSYEMEGSTKLAWQIQPPKTSPLPVTYQFTLWFTLGGAIEAQPLVSADGTPIDPTIVEKPPDH